MRGMTVFMMSAPISSIASPETLSPLEPSAYGSNAQQDRSRANWAARDARDKRSWTQCCTEQPARFEMLCRRLSSTWIVGGPTCLTH